MGRVWVGASGEAGQGHCSCTQGPDTSNPLLKRQSYDEIEPRSL